MKKYFLIKHKEILIYILMAALIAANTEVTNGD